LALNGPRNAARHLLWITNELKMGLQMQFIEEKLAEREGFYWNISKTRCKRMHLSLSAAA
jgi:hypothetical protein